MQYERNVWRSLLALFEISAGRFFTYAIFGIAAGILGANIAQINRDLFTAIAYILFSIFLLITTFRTNKKDLCCHTGRWASFVDRPVLLGLFTGINFCPSFLLAITKAVDLSGPWAGLAIFTSFFAGTLLFLIPLSFLGYFGIKKKFRIIARIAAILVSTWFITQAAIMLFSHIKEKELTTSIDPKLIINVLDSSPAYIMTNDTSAMVNLQLYLEKAKKKSVTFFPAVLSTHLPDSGIFFIGQELIEGLHIENHPLRKKGRFIIVLPDPSNHFIDTTRVKTFIDFLSFYSFKIDPDSGTIFQVPKNLSIVNLK